MSVFPDIDAAIAQFEGYNAPGSIAARNNNPGDIQAGSFATAHGATGSENGFATFPDPTTGFAATDALVQHYADNGSTLSQLINSWSPGSAPGNTPAGTQNYLSFVSQQTGIDPNDSPYASGYAGTPSTTGSDVSVPTTGPGTGSGWLDQALRNLIPQRSLSSDLSSIGQKVSDGVTGTIVGNVVNSGPAINDLVSKASTSLGVLDQITNIFSTITALFSQWSFGRIASIVGGLLFIAGAVLAFSFGSLGSGIDKVKAVAL